jgi:hypothetical protein
LTLALQKIDNALDPIELVQTLITVINQNPSLKVMFCTLVSSCIYTTTTTTTTVTPTTTSTTSSSTSTTTSTSTSTSTTSTSTSTTTTVPPTTTTTTTSGFFNLGVYIRTQVSLSPSADVKIKYSTNGGSTWTDYGSPSDPSIGNPNYNGISGLIIPSGSNVLVGLTNSSGGNIQYGSGSYSSDFTSLCGLSSPFVISSMNSNTNVYLNINVSGGALVNC